MRIIGGKLRGSKLYLPKNKDTRPLKDMVRESIFNLLIHSNKIAFKFERSSILDLYSGTGSFGLECLSRGSKQVCFFEKDKNIIEVLEKNIIKLNLIKKTNIFSTDVFSIKEGINIIELKFDIIFCDPPFKNNDVGKLLEVIFQKKLLKKNGVIIIHRHKNNQDEPYCKFNIIEERVYGLSKIVFGNF